MYEDEGRKLGCRIARRLYRRLRIQILQILKVPKIQQLLRISKLSVLKFIKFKLLYSSPPRSNKLFVANTALNFWIKNSVMSTIQLVNSSTVQHCHEQLITKSTSRLQLHCLPWCQNRSYQLPTVPVQQLPQCNQLLVLCKFEKFAVTSDAIKRIFTNFKKLKKK